MVWQHIQWVVGHERQCCSQRSGFRRFEQPQGERPVLIRNDGSQLEFQREPIAQVDFLKRWSAATGDTFENSVDLALLSVGSSSATLLIRCSSASDRVITSSPTSRGHTLLFPPSRTTLPPSYPSIHLRGSWTSSSHGNVGVRMTSHRSSVTSPSIRRRLTNSCSSMREQQRTRMACGIRRGEGDIWGMGGHIFIVGHWNR